MDLQLTFFANDCLAIFAALLLGAGVLRADPRNVSARLFALLQVNNAGYVVFSRAIMSGWLAEPLRIVLDDRVLLVLQVLMNTTPGLFMVLCFTLFRDDVPAGQHFGGANTERFAARIAGPTATHFPRWLLALFVLQVALEELLPYLAGVTTHPSRFVTMTDSHLGWYLLFEALPTGLEALFIAMALYWTVKEWRADLVALRRQLRALVLGVTGVFQITFTLITRLLIANDDVRMLYVHEAYLALGTLLNAAAIVWLLNPRQWLAATTQLSSAISLVGSAAVAAPITTSTDTAGASAEKLPDNAASVDADYSAFAQAMSTRAYEEAGMTVASLARQLRMPEYRLRKLINEKLGYRNFNAMLHAFRIEAACVELRDPTKRHLPVLTIALSLGYQSINPFNRAFRELKGCTPTEYRQLDRSASSTPATH